MASNAQRWLWTAASLTGLGPKFNIVVRNISAANRNNATSLLVNQQQGNHGTGKIEDLFASYFAS